MISPPSKARGYWTAGDGRYETADQWRKSAERHEGTWWEDWTRWLEQRSGKQVDPPPMGSALYPALEDAPGIYVRETPSE